MPTFWDLPKAVREKIYRLDLVREDRITEQEHCRIVEYEYRRHQPRFMPPLLRVSKKADAEAAAIYYGENHFEFSPVSRSYRFASITYPRHLRLVRRVTCEWASSEAREGFLAIARMKGLQELYIRVNERQMVIQSLQPRYREHWWIDRDPTPQQQLAILRYPGITGLLSLSGIPNVQFIKTFNFKKEETGGPIPGGILETQVRQKIMSTNRSATHVGLEDDTFPFLKLPAEIRNRIYDLLLCIPGQLHPSTNDPSSMPRKIRNRRSMPPSVESALSLLAVNKQINDEALGIFYHRNSFEFYYPTQFHAFALSLGQQRLGFLRDITIYYYNTKSGGIDLAELTFPILKQLPGLRRLHVILRNDIENKISRTRWWITPGWHMEKANPLSLPGIKVLFSLRGLTDIKLRDLSLEKEFEKAKSDKEYPHFSAKSKQACVVQPVKALEHFNHALTDAQTGKVNMKLMQDPEWHMKDVFPTMDDEDDTASV